MNRLRKTTRLYNGFSLTAVRLTNVTFYRHLAYALRTTRHKIFTVCTAYKSPKVNRNTCDWWGIKGIQLVQNKWAVIWWTTGAALQHSYDYLEVCKFCMQNLGGLGDFSQKVLKGAVSHFRSGPPFAFKERSNFPWKKRKERKTSVSIVFILSSGLS